MMQALAQLPLARLTRSPWAWLPVVFWGLVAIVVAFAARRMGSSGGGIDRALLGGFGSVAMPLLSFAVVGATLSSDSLKTAIRPVVALGASPAHAALATVLTGMLTSAALSGMLGIVVVLAAGSAHVASDLVSALWIGALGGACYAAWFSFGATFGQRGAGRATLLVFDYLFGATSGGTVSAIALLTPRGNVHSLLGGVSPSDISQRTSSVALILLTAACVLFTLRRTRTA
ncbi:hypothetical protein LZC95_04085 [Pendulispora brunnea]|uniref:ABC transporter permease n=1 Tax=Pendulispora brunnea TaxID=2905690 RepID=A0ABZ2KBE8_9BACT